LRHEGFDGGALGISKAHPVRLQRSRRLGIWRVRVIGQVLHHSISGAMRGLASRVFGRTTMYGPDRKAVRAGGCRCRYRLYAAAIQSCWKIEIEHQSQRQLAARFSQMGAMRLALRARGLSL